MTGKKSRFLAGMLRGFAAYLRGPALVNQHRLWRWLWTPALLGLALSVLMVVGLLVGFESFHAWLDAKIALQTGWLDTLVGWSIAIVAVVSAVAGFVFLQKHLVLVLLAPFLGMLAEATVRRIEGDVFVPGLQFVDSIVRSAKVNTRSVVYEIVAVVGFFLLGLIVPVVGSVISSVAVLLIQNCFLGNGLLDFPLEYRGRSVQQSVAFCRRHRGEATGLGLGYFLTMLVPVLGWMLAPTLGTVAGTKLAMDLISDDGAGDEHEADR